MAARGLNFWADSVSFMQHNSSYVQRTMPNMKFSSQCDYLLTNLMTKGYLLLALAAQNQLTQKDEEF